MLLVLKVILVESICFIMLNQTHEFFEILINDYLSIKFKIKNLYNFLGWILVDSCMMSFLY